MIVQLAGFEEGELLLYERLQMAPLLLERYSKDGSEKSRRQMLAMGQSDPEILAQVLGRLVNIAGQKLQASNSAGASGVADDDSDYDEVEDILDDIREALTIARRQGVLTPVRIARILAGEGTGQFREQDEDGQAGTALKPTVPLSVALDYVGSILEESRKETSRLEAEVEEYNKMCLGMEEEIESLLQASSPGTHRSTSAAVSAATSGEAMIEEIQAKLMAVGEGATAASSSTTQDQQQKESFWREMREKDSFDTIARFFAKGVIP